MTAVGILAVLGVLVLVTWLPRGSARRSAPGAGGFGRDRTPAGRFLTRGTPWPPWAGRRWTRRRRASPDVAVVISEVAARLRSGAPVEQAWSAAVGRLLGPGHVAADDPPGQDVGAAPLPHGLQRLVQACRGDPAAVAAVQAVAAATRLSRTTGAPLAGALDRCVETVVEAERAHDARSIALAGPRSTARILTGLPLLGVVLGAGLGADPVATALDGGWGTVSVGIGGALLYGGARWSAALVRAAEVPGGEPRWRAKPAVRGRAGHERGGRRWDRGRW